MKFPAIEKVEFLATDFIHTRVTSESQTAAVINKCVAHWNQDTMLLEPTTHLVTFT